MNYNNKACLAKYLLDLMRDKNHIEWPYRYNN